MLQSNSYHNEATKGEMLSKELEQIWLTIIEHNDKAPNSSQQGGGYKLVSLICLLLANSDDKRGHTMDFRTFLAPKTDLKLKPCSLSRYFVHEHNAGRILSMKSHILDYLETKRISKQTGEYNNLEKNSSEGLQDPATIDELIAMAHLDVLILSPFLKKVSQLSF